MKSGNRKIVALLFAGTGLLCTLMTGCGQKSGAQLDTADEKDAYVSKGLELVQQKDWDSAVKQFDAALIKKPELARPDLELAMIYHQQKKNYARAIYYYERYLEKRPLSEKRPLILEWVKQAKISLVGEVGGAGSDVSEELVRLTRENNLLRKQLEPASGSSAPSPAATAKPFQETSSLQPATAARTTSAATAARTYQVRPGDTLSRIAVSVYGDASLWKKIYEANCEQMKNESDIKAGQTLTIPNQ